VLTILLSLSDMAMQASLKNAATKTQKSFPESVTIGKSRSTADGENWSDTRCCEELWSEWKWDNSKK